MVPIFLSSALSHISELVSLPFERYFHIVTGGSIVAANWGFLSTCCCVAGCKPDCIRIVPRSHRQTSVANKPPLYFSGRTRLSQHLTTRRLIWAWTAGNLSTRRCLVGCYLMNIYVRSGSAATDDSRRRFFGQISWRTSQIRAIYVLKHDNLELNVRKIDSTETEELSKLYGTMI